MRKFRDLVIDERSGRTVDPIKKRVVARYNCGRWIADCPDCNGAEEIRVGQKFVCGSEYAIFHPVESVRSAAYAQAEKDGRVYDIEWPDAPTRSAILDVLSRRPNPDNRNWQPDETIDYLEMENRASGNLSSLFSISIP